MFGICVYIFVYIYIYMYTDRGLWNYLKSVSLGSRRYDKPWFRALGFSVAGFKP